MILPRLQRRDAVVDIGARTQLLLVVEIERDGRTAIHERLVGTLRAAIEVRHQDPAETIVRSRSQRADSCVGTTRDATTRIELLARQWRRMGGVDIENTKAEEASQGPFGFCVEIGACCSIALRLGLLASSRAGAVVGPFLRRSRRRLVLAE